MIHIMKEKRYHSPLREEQMEKTREQIIEALVRTMAHGMAALSIPAVAREAGVSVPTVYRHFHTKRELIESLGGYLLKKIGFTNLVLPHSPQELASSVQDLFVMYEGTDEALRAAAMSEFAYEARKQALPARLKIIEDALAPVRLRFNDEDWRRLCTIAFILSTTAIVRAFKDYLDLSGEEAGSTVAWAILTLAGSTSRSDNQDTEKP